MENSEVEKLRENNKFLSETILNQDREINKQLDIIKSVYKLLKDNPNQVDYALKILKGGLNEVCR